MRRTLFTLAAIFTAAIFLLLALVAASYAFNFQIPWVNLAVAWVMIVVPSSLFVIATATGNSRKRK